MNDHLKEAKEISTADWLVGGGEMGALIRSMDWSKTPLGPIESWPHSLRTTLSICLASRFPMAVWWGPEITQLYNDGYRPFLGIKHPRSMGQPGDECWAEIWDVCGPLYRKVMETGESTWSADLQLLMERNRYLEETYFTFAYSPIRDEEGAIRGNLITVTETTERVLGERRLRTLRDLGGRASQARSAEGACEIAAQILQTNTADIPFALVYLLDPERTVAHLVSVSNLDRQSAAAPHKIDLSERRDEVWPLDAVARTQQPELVINLEQRLAQLPGGSWPESPRSALVLPLVSPGQQQVTGFLVAGVNPRRILDDQYRDFFNLVAGHVATAVANARAHEEEHRRAEALAEIDRAKTAFFNNVSHEFRTPLTLMLGPVEETLADAKTPAAVRKRLEVSQRNSLRLLKLVNSLLDFSRIEAGRIQAVYEPTDLGALTAELASNFRSACEKAGLKLLVNCDPLTESVYVDREMWEKIVLNLVSNAFKYTLSGQIEVSLKQVRDAAELSVRDTGIGIPADEMPNIFQRFYRIEGARGRTHEGTGIGLSLVQELVKFHGGTIRVDSVYGEGSIFTVSIPMGSAHLPADRTRASAPRTLASTRIAAGAYVEEALRWLPEATAGQGETLFPPTSSPPSTPITTDSLMRATFGARVIIADDNADMRDYIRRLLAQHYRVETVADGEAALAAARREKPDLIVADVMMPVMDGFALLRAIREDEALKTVLVMMLSARAGEESRVEGLARGADDYLIKPFSARELLARVGAQLELSWLRRDAEQKLRESEERFRSLVGVITDVPWTTDAEGAFVMFQPKWAEYTGQTWEEHRRFGWANALHPADREHVKAIWQRACESRTLYQSEGRLWHAPTKQWRYFIAKATPLLNVDGSVREWVGTCTDVDEQKRGQERLESLVAERTQELQQANAVLLRDMEERKKLEEQLLQAQKMESVGTLAGGIAHDFNNILNIIQGYAFTLQEYGVQNQRIGESLTVINETVQRGSALVQQLLTLARKGSPKLETVNVNVVVEGLISLIRQTFPKTIELGASLEANMPPLMADKHLVEQALLNLCVNARDAMSDRGKLIFKTQLVDGASLRGLDKTIEGSYVTIEVTDTGIGMDESVRKRIFEPFFTTKDKGRGTGLGLSVVYGIVKNHNGFINVESHPMSGTSFRLYFPVMTSEVSATEPVLEFDTQTSAASNGAATVLLVEDEPNMLYVLEKTLLRHGYKVLQACDGDMAVEIYRCHKQAIDAVMLDLGLPKMGGRDVLFRLKKENPDVKVVIATGYLDPELKSEINRAGVKHFLQKPYLPGEVIKTFQSLIEREP